MGFYLIDKPPVKAQYRRIRRGANSGVVVLHSAENVPDLDPPDTGAENVAAYISRRTSYGSYHDVCDSDSGVALIPWMWEAFHDGTGTNSHSVGISAAWSVKHLPRLLRHHRIWVDAVIARMADRAAAYARWLYDERGITIPPRRISVPEARAGLPGFITHAELDPSRRTDPGFGYHPELFDQFLAEYGNLVAASEEDDPMAGITLDQIGMKTIEAIRWCVGKDNQTRDRIRELVPSLDSIGLKAIQAVRWCVSEDEETRGAIKRLVNDALNERDAA